MIPVLMNLLGNKRPRRNHEDPVWVRLWFWSWSCSGSGPGSGSGSCGFIFVHALHLMRLVTWSALARPVNRKCITFKESTSIYGRSSADR